MTRNLNKTYIHLIFSTKHRLEVIDRKMRADVFAFIKKESLKASKSYVKACNGYTDHVHVLIWLHPTESISHVVKQIKGSSSSFMSRRLDDKDIYLKWQRGYFVESVSPGSIEKVKEYIQNQERRHGQCK